MYRTAKLFNKKLVVLFFTSLICTAQIISSDHASKNIILIYGLEPQFSNPHYTLYSDRDLSAAAKENDNLPPLVLGRTKLHCASLIKEAQEALKYGADINAVDNNGLTAIQFMIIRKCYSTAVYLLNNKAKISAADKKYLMQQYKLEYLQQKALFPKKFK